MTDITVTKGSVSLLNNGPSFRVTAGATITAGQAVYINGTSGADLVDGDAANTAKCVGIVVAPQDAVSGDVLDVAGPGCVVGGFSGMTAGNLLFVSATAGALADAAATKSKPVARAITTTEILVTLEGLDPA